MPSGWLLSLAAAIFTGVVETPCSLTLPPAISRLSQDHETLGNNEEEWGSGYFGFCLCADLDVQTG